MNVESDLTRHLDISYAEPQPNESLLHLVARLRIRDRHPRTKNLTRYAAKTSVTGTAQAHIRTLNKTQINGFVKQKESIFFIFYAPRKLITNRRQRLKPQSNRKPDRDHLGFARCQSKKFCYNKKHEIKFSSITVPYFSGRNPCRLPLFNCAAETRSARPPLGFNTSHGDHQSCNAPRCRDTAPPKSGSRATR